MLLSEELCKQALREKFIVKKSKQREKTQQASLGDQQNRLLTEMWMKLHQEL